MRLNDADWAFWAGYWRHKDGTELTRQEVDDMHRLPPVKLAKPKPPKQGDG